MNKTKQFILPLFCEFIYFNFKIYKKIITNTYIYNNGIVLECTEDIKQEDDFLESIYDSKLLDKIETLNNKIFYFLKIPEEYNIEFELLKKGKYSKINKIIKDLILDFYIKLFKKDTNSISLILNTKHVLFKDQKLKRKLEKDLNVNIDENAELCDSPNENEYYES